MLAPDRSEWIVIGLALTQFLGAWSSDLGVLIGASDLISHPVRKSVMVSPLGCDEMRT
jgi:hypothetical protein